MVEKSVSIYNTEAICLSITKQLGRACSAQNVHREEQNWSNISIMNQNEWRQTPLGQLQGLRWKNCKIEW